MNLNPEQVDILHEFLHASIDVANYGMKQSMVGRDGLKNRYTITGERFQAALAKFAVLLGVNITWTDQAKIKKADAT